MANVLLLNGSPHAHGAIDLALTEVAQTLQECGLTTEIVHVGQQDIRGCIACGRCGVLHRCAFDDAVNALAPKFEYTRWRCASACSAIRQQYFILCPTRAGIDL